MRLQSTFIALAALLLTAPVSAQGLPDFTELVERAGPAVVNIRVRQFGDNGPNGEPEFDLESVPEFFRPFVDPNDPRFGSPDRLGAGSGFILEEDGYIVTNHHVVDGADEIIVRLPDRREFEAELIGSDAPSDIALLKVDAEDLPTLPLGQSQPLKQGEWVLAIGSPFNFDQSVTAGIVSAKGRSNQNQQYVPFIQTDVAINRGNSGGPLLNLRGEVVGINSWILSSSGGYQGLSFAIPIEVAARTIRQLQETGRVQRGLLGVQIGPVTRELAEALDLDRPIGAVVAAVTPEGAADRAGIEAGDVIVGIDEQSVETSAQLPPLVGARAPGTEVDVHVIRNGREETFQATLDALEPSGDQLASAETDVEERSNVLGLAVSGLSDEQRREAGSAIEGGVVVTAVESREAWRAGLREGAIVLAINNQPVRDMEDFNDIVDTLETDKAVALRVFINGTTTFIAYTPRDED